MPASSAYLRSAPAWRNILLLYVRFSDEIKANSFVGSELDTIAGSALTRFLGLEVGYGHFFTGNYIRQSLSAVGSKDANWFYAQLTVAFEGIEMEPAVGFEPTTDGLQNRCSTTELSWRSRPNAM